MVDLIVEPGFFSEYEVEDTGLLSFSWETFHRILSRTHKDDIVGLSKDEESSSVMITVTGRTTRTYKIPLRSSEDYKRGNDPRGLKLPAKIGINPDLFKEVVGDMSVVQSRGSGEGTELICIDISEEKMQFSTEIAQQTAKIEIELGSHEDVKMREIEEPALSYYTLRSLRDISKLTSTSTDLFIEIGNEEPLRMTFEVCEGMTLMYLLAPNTQPDEDFEDEID